MLESEFCKQHDFFKKWDINLLLDVGVIFMKLI